MTSNPANGIKDLMWMALMDKGQKPNIPELKELVYTLIQATVQKDAGQRGKSANFDWKNLDMLMMQICCEATALVLSGELDKLEAG